MVEKIGHFLGIWTISHDDFFSDYDCSCRIHYYGKPLYLRQILDANLKDI